MFMVFVSGGSGIGLEFWVDQEFWQFVFVFEGLSLGIFIVEVWDGEGCIVEQEIMIVEVLVLLIVLDFVCGCGLGESVLQVRGSGGNGGL